MRISRRINFLLISVVAVFIAAVILSQYFANKELAELLKDKEREVDSIFSSILELKGRPLKALVYDYSFWDEMVNFTKDPQQPWADSNLYTALFTYDVDTIRVYSISSSLIYSIARQGKSFLEESPLPVRDLSELFGQSQFCHFFVDTSQGPLEVRGATIHPGSDPERKTQSQGYLFAGRLWGQDYMNKLSALMASNISVNELGSRLPTIRPQDAKVRFFKLLNGWDGRPLKRIVGLYESCGLKSFAESTREKNLLFLSLAIIFLFFVSAFLRAWINTPLRLILTTLRKEDTFYLKNLERKKTEFGDISRLIDDFFAQRDRLLEEIAERKKAEDEVRRLATFPQLNPNPVLEVSRSGEVIFYNNAAVEALKDSGLREEDVRVFLAEDIKAVFDIVQWNVQKSFYREITLKDRSFAEYIYFAPDTFTLRINAIDITQLKRTEAALRSSEETTRALLNSTPDYAYLIDRQGNILSVNEAGARRLKGSPDEIVGSNVLSFFSPEVCARRKEKIDQAISTKIPVHFIDEREGAYLDNTIYPIINSEGEVEKLSIFARDITEGKLMEDKIRHLASFPRYNPNPVLEVDSSGEIVFFNDASIKILTDLGLDSRHIRKFLPEDVTAVLQDLLQGERKVIYREVKIKDRIFGEHIYLAPEFNSLRLYGFEITRERVFQERLQDSENKYRGLVEQVHAIIFTADIDELTTPLYVSPQVKDILGFEPEEFLSDPSLWQRILHPDDRQAVLMQLLLCRQTGKPLSVEGRVFGKQGNVVWLRTEASIVYDEAGKPLFLRGLMFDITRHKHMEEELNKAYEQLSLTQAQLIQASKMAALERLASGIAHEINNPLTGVLNNIQLLIAQLREKKDIRLNDLKNNLGSYGGFRFKVSRHNQVPLELFPCLPRAVSVFFAE